VVVDNLRSLDCDDSTRGGVWSKTGERASKDKISSSENNLVIYLCPSPISQVVGGFGSLAQMVFPVEFEDLL
jgi:hypothetical protein